MPIVDELPGSVDVVVLGTGLPESIIAAACARTGLSVLHLDRNDYYGDLWSSFNLRTIHDWITKDNRNGNATDINPESVLRDGEQFIAASCQSLVENIRVESHFGPAADQKCDITVPSADWQDIDPEWRKYSLDLLPKVLLSRGDMVKLLCDSGVAKYCEFKCVDRFLGCSGSNEGSSGTISLSVVPCSRAEIYQTDAISVLEKRWVMRFLQFCIDWRRDPGSVEDLKEYAEWPFHRFLELHGITTDRLKSLITDTLAILHPNAKTEEGLVAVCQFLESVGRYGDSPFLWTLYGSGELPQCFCRLCAVFGGIYCLDRQVDGFILANGRIVAVVTNGQRIDCNYVIANYAYIPQKYVDGSSTKRLNRAILISEGSVLPDPEKEHITLLNLTNLEKSTCPYLLEVGYEGCAAPKGKYVVHITTARSAANDASSILTPIVEKLFTTTADTEGRKPRLLWSLYFDLLSSTSVNSDVMPINMRIVPGIDDHINYTEIVAKTKAIFDELWADRDFLPPAAFEQQEEDESMNDSAPIDSEQQQVRENPDATFEMDGVVENSAP